MSRARVRARGHAQPHRRRKGDRLHQERRRAHALAHHRAPHTGQHRLQAVALIAFDRRTGRRSI